MSEEAWVNDSQDADGLKSKLCFSLLISEDNQMEIRGRGRERDGGRRLIEVAGWGVINKDIIPDCLNTLFRYPL